MSALQRVLYVEDDRDIREIAGMDGPETLASMRRQGSVTESTVVAFMTAKVYPDELLRYKQRLSLMKSLQYGML